MRRLVNSGVDAFAQNLETVERLTHPVRDPRASRPHLAVLRSAKALAGGGTKSSPPLGRGDGAGSLKLDDLRRRRGY